MVADFEITEFNKDLDPHKFKKDRSIMTVNLEQLNMSKK